MWYSTDYLKIFLNYFCRATALKLTLLKRLKNQFILLKLSLLHVYAPYLKNTCQNEKLYKKYAFKKELSFCHQLRYPIIPISLQSNK